MSTTTERLTTEALAQMTPSEKERRIAALCPDLFIHVPSPFGVGTVHWKTGQDDDGNDVTPGIYVDVLDDLNAMHEAEKVMSDRQLLEYADNLARDLGFGTAALCATAAQRADAFLLTLG